MSGGDLYKSQNDQTHICARTLHLRVPAPLCSQTLSCVHTHPQMRTHQTQTASIMHHFDVWGAKPVDVWWNHVMNFLFFLWTFFRPELTLQTHLGGWTGEEGERRGHVFGEMCFMFWMHDMFVCAYITDLSHKSSFSFLRLLLFVVCPVC